VTVTQQDEQVSI